MRIHKLNPQVIDQIAAGEVLERPANLVKELIENSMDAGASEIQIDIWNGGRHLVISDNGWGMEKEDLPLALERHATSKITESDDLWKLSTFGFRGEALASGAAVSKMRVSSRAKNQKQAYQIQSDFGVLSEITSTSRDVGTTIEVQDLFENVPARMKFLKSESSEVSQIKRVLRALALMHPETAFTLRLNNELVYHWPSVESHQSRVEAVLDQKVLHHTQGGFDGKSVEIFFSSPNDVQKTSQNIWLFVNGRWIQDRSLQSAVMESYRNLLMHGEWPTAVVILEVDPEMVDVNVHPTKSQVKFADPRSVFSLIHSQLRRKLEAAPWLGDMLKPDKILSIVPEPQQSTLMDLGSAHFKQKENFAGITETLKKYKSPRGDEEPLDPIANSGEPLWRNLQVIGQVGLTYIVAQSHKGLMLIDQHASHERVAFERLMKSWREKKPEIQSFLIPLSIKMEAQFIEALLVHSDRLHEMGVEIEQGGPEILLVSSAPSVVKESALSKSLEDMAREIAENGDSFSFDRKIGDIFATMACHSVVRAGQSLCLEEMSSLLEQMDEFPLSSFCPHGRPVFVELTFRELDERFGRIV